MSAPAHSKLTRLADETHRNMRDLFAAMKAEFREIDERIARLEDILGEKDKAENPAAPRTMSFECPRWPGCGCPDGTVDPDCPGLDALKAK